MTIINVSDGNRAVGTQRQVASSRTGNNIICRCNITRLCCMETIGILLGVKGVLLAWFMVNWLMVDCAGGNEIDCKLLRIVGIAAGVGLATGGCCIGALGLATG